MLEDLSMKLPETSALPTTGKRVENTKKRGFQPEKSGGSPAAADLAAVYWLDIYGKTFAGFCPQKPENPHEY